MKATVTDFISLSKSLSSHYSGIIMAVAGCPTSSFLPFPKFFSFHFLDSLHGLYCSNLSYFP